MTAGSCSSHPRRLVASVSWYDPSSDARSSLRAAADDARTSLSVEPEVAVGDHGAGLLQLILCAENQRGGKANHGSHPASRQ